MISFEQINEQEPFLKDDFMPYGVPQIIYSTRLGKHFSSIDVDQSAVAERMKSTGFSDEQIGRTVVYVTDEKSYAQRSEEVLALGDYNRASEVINVYAASTKSFIDNSVSFVNNSPSYMGSIPDGNEDFVKFLGEKLTSRELSTTIYHELEHRKIEIIGFNDDKDKPNRWSASGVLYKLRSAIAAGLYVGLVSPLTPAPNNLENVLVIGGAAAATFINMLPDNDLKYRKEVFIQNEKHARRAEKELETSFVDVEYRKR